MVAAWSLVLGLLRLINLPPYLKLSSIYTYEFLLDKGAEFSSIWTSILSQLLILKTVWSRTVTPRSRGYGNVTATYIHMVEIPSHMYAKHQYIQELEYGSTLVIYIPKERYKYTIITERDPILHNITLPDGVQVWFTRGCTIYKSWKMLMTSKEEPR